MEDLEIVGISNNTTKSSSHFYRDLSGKMSESMLHLNQSNTKSVIKYAVEQTNGHCLYCGRKLYSIQNNQYKFIPDTSLDHLIPVSCWGLFSKGNIALACKHCNSSRQSMAPVDYFRKMHSSGIPTLYDTELEFINKVNQILEPYKQEYPQLYDLGYKFLFNQIQNEKVTVSVSYIDNGIIQEVSIPLSHSFETLDINNVPIVDDNPELEMFSALKKHVIKMSGIINPAKRASFINALDGIFESFYDFGFKTVESLKNINTTTIHSVSKKTKKRQSISKKRVDQAMSYLGVALDNVNFEIQSGIMPKIIEIMGAHYIFEGV